MELTKRLQANSGEGITVEDKDGVALGHSQSKPGGAAGSQRLRFDCDRDRRHSAGVLFRNRPDVVGAVTGGQNNAGNPGTTEPVDQPHKEWRSANRCGNLLPVGQDFPQTSAEPAGKNDRFNFGWRVLHQRVNRRSLSRPTRSRQ